MLTSPETRERMTTTEALRAYIQQRGYGVGDRIPPERELIVDLGLTRSALRKALDALEHEGAIWRHVGKGTFIGSGRAAELPGDLTSLAAQLTPVRMMRARLCIESAISREAAINASAEAIATIKSAQHGAQMAETWAEYEQHDDLFHRAVATATDNPLLEALFDQLNSVRRTVGWTKLVRETGRPESSHSSFAEHDAILAAIEARDPSRAYEAMRRHISSVSSRLFSEP